MIAVTLAERAAAYRADGNLRQAALVKRVKAGVATANPGATKIKVADVADVRFPDTRVPGGRRGWLAVVTGVAAGQPFTARATYCTGLPGDPDTLTISPVVTA